MQGIKSSGSELEAWLCLHNLSQSLLLHLVKEVITNNNNSDDGGGDGGENKMD